MLTSFWTLAETLIVVVAEVLVHDVEVVIVVVDSSGSGGGSNGTVHRSGDHNRY